MIEDIEFFSGAPEQSHWPVLFDIESPVKYDNPKRCVLNYNPKVSNQVNDYIDISFVPLIGSAQGAVLSPLLFIFYMKGFLQDADLTYNYADDSTSLSSKENLSTLIEWRTIHTNGGRR